MNCFPCAGNAAAMYGGCIHVVIHGELSVRDSVFYTPDSDQGLEDGTVMSSFGKRFVLTNVDIYQVGLNAYSHLPQNGIRPNLSEQIGSAERWEQ